MGTEKESKLFLTEINLKTIEGNYKHKCAKVNVFIGPNGSGKTTFVRNLVNIIRHKNTGELIISNIRYNEDVNKSFLESNFVKNPPFTFLTAMKIINDNAVSNVTTFDIEWFRRALVQEELYADRYSIFEELARNRLVQIDGAHRLQTLQRVPLQNLFEKPNNIMNFLYQNDQIRLDISKRIFEMLSKHLLITSCIQPGMLDYRIAQTHPGSSAEKSHEIAHVNFFMSNTEHIEEQSAGFQALISTIILIHATEDYFYVSDEIDAFLHPSLSFKLGRYLGKYFSSQPHKQLFCTTHSSAFLFGLIVSGVDVSISRFDYESGKFSVQSVNQNSVNNLSRDPLLRSSRTIEAMFYKNVVVCEGDSDRVIYQEVNDRMNSINNNGIEDAYFINAQNKQTVSRIVSILKPMGIKVVGIFDLDFFKEGGTNLSSHLDAFEIPTGFRRTMETARQDVHIILSNKGSGTPSVVAEPLKDKTEYRKIKELTASEKDTLDQTLHNFSRYGIFIVPCGELEDWLRYLGVQVHKSQWAPAVLERMGSDPESETYERPTDDDVWAFIASIRDYLKR